MPTVQITESTLLAVMPTARERAPLYVAPLQAAMDAFGISESPQRAAMFLAQIAHESGELRYVREVWGPTAAQEGYEGREDLGNTEHGDGFNFRGWGPIETTGRANTLKASYAIYGDDRLVQQPALLSDKTVGCKGSAFFWHEHGLNELADAGDFEATCDIVNRGHKTKPLGDSNGYKFRLGYWIAAKAALGFE